MHSSMGRVTVLAEPAIFEAYFFNCSLCGLDISSTESVHVDAYFTDTVIVDASIT